MGSETVKIPRRPFFRRKRSQHSFDRHANRRFADLYEGNVGYNAARYAAGGAPFIVLKATEGIGHVDVLHATRCEVSHFHGLAVGHYHFYIENGRPELQARHFWETVRPHYLVKWPHGRGHDAMPDSHKDFLIVDVETEGSSVPDRGELANFCRELYRISKQEIIGYSGRSFLLEHNLHVPGDKWWVADYPFFPGNIGPRILWAHQFTDAGHIPGVGPACDCSVLVARDSIRYWARQ